MTPRTTVEMADASPPAIVGVILDESIGLPLGKSEGKQTIAHRRVRHVDENDGLGVIARFLGLRRWVRATNARLVKIGVNLRFGAARSW